MHEFAGVGARPSRSDTRGFVHKRIFGGIKGAIGGFISGGPLGAIGGAARGILAPTRPRPIPQVTRQCPPGFTLTTSGCAPTFAPAPVFAPMAPPPAVSRGRGRGLGPTVTTGFQEEDFGDAVKGRFGAALEPAVRDTETRVCPRGSVLAVDGLCYNRRDIRNNERMWPRGRRPLLTGGEMRCISVASSAAKKLQRKQKQLEQLGMLKRPARRSTQRALPGHHEHVAHN